MKRILRLGAYLVSMIVFPAAVFFGLPVDVPYTVVEQYDFSRDAVFRFDWTTDPENPANPSIFRTIGAV